MQLFKVLVSCCCFFRAVLVMILDSHWCCLLSGCCSCLILMLMLLAFLVVWNCRRSCRHFRDCFVFFILFVFFLSCIAGVVLVDVVDVVFVLFLLTEFGWSAVCDRGRGLRNRVTMDQTAIVVGWRMVTTRGPVPPSSS